MATFSEGKKYQKAVLLPSELFVEESAILKWD